MLAVSATPANKTQIHRFAESNNTRPSEALHDFFGYLKNTWIQGNVWTPADWSVSGQSIRTNNDTEEWHHRLNQLCVRLGNNVNVYKLI